MSEFHKILKSFRLKDSLNTDIWEKTNGTYTMKSKVRERLLKIANDFIEFLDVNFVISDIIMSGSLANYNWSDYSDVDIHVIADFTQFNESEKPLYEDLFYLKKSIYNKKHDITIYGFEVELYVEDESQVNEVKSIAKYSILNDVWVETPINEPVDISNSKIKSKAQQWMNIIDKLIDNVKDEDFDEAKELIDKYNDKLRKYRTCGLQKDGEYSEENLVFKVLRRNGYLDKIRNLKDELTDKKLTLKEFRY
jgi:predicted nucleotidyltransferase